MAAPRDLIERQLLPPSPGKPTNLADRNLAYIFDSVGLAEDTQDDFLSPLPLASSCSVPTADFLLFPLPSQLSDYVWRMAATDKDTWPNHAGR